MSPAPPGGHIRTQDAQHAWVDRRGDRRGLALVFTTRCRRGRALSSGGRGEVSMKKATILAVLVVVFAVAACSGDEAEPVE